MELTDKDIHCLARHLQGTFIDDEDFSPCHYCKYSISCAEHSANRFKDTGKVRVYYYADELIPKLESMTGLTVFRFRKPSTDCLAGSWLEEYPDLMKLFTKLSFAERLDILRNEDILDYTHNPTSDRLQMLQKSR